VPDEVLRPIDGIDDPAAVGGALLPELLPEEADLGEGAAEAGGDGRLGLPVRLSHRGLVRLDGDLEAAVIVAQRDLARLARGGNRGGDDRMGRWGRRG
jgi:hypothetical protein